MPIHYQAWVCPRVSWGCAWYSSSRSWSGGIHCEVPKPPQLAHLNSKEQWLWGSPRLFLSLSERVSPAEEPHFHHLYSLFFWSSPTAHDHRWGQECRMTAFVHILHSSTVYIHVQSGALFFHLVKVFVLIFCLWQLVLQLSDIPCLDWKIVNRSSNFISFKFNFISAIFSRGSWCYSVMCSRLSMFSNLKQCDYWK